MKLRNYTFLLLLFLSFGLYANNGGYAIVRVFDCTKGASSGKEFMDPQILITYENGDSEVIELGYFSEKDQPENLKKLVAAFNDLRKKGYTLISSSSTGDQGNLVFEYIFLKP